MPGEQLSLLTTSRSALWARKNPDKLKVHKYRFRYGINSLEELEALKQQPCEICGRKQKKMDIDHAHAPRDRKHNGTYRGVLCRGCNLALGWYEANSEKVAKYLKLKGN